VHLVESCQVNEKHTSHSANPQQLVYQICKLGFQFFANLLHQPEQAASVHLTMFWIIDRVVQLGILLRTNRHGNAINNI